MSFSQHLAADRRLALLQALHSAAQYRANATLLQRYCDRVGHVVSADRIEQDLAWLSEQGLVALERVEGLTIAVLTLRGADVATGRARVPDVAAPQPPH